jgi:hypothetical protein
VLGQADVGDVIRRRGQDLCRAAPEYTRSARYTRPLTIDESLIARKSSFEASPSATIHTFDWQPFSRFASVFNSSGRSGSFRPRSIRYW